MPPLRIKSLLESNPSKPKLLVGGLGVYVIGMIRMVCRWYGMIWSYVYTYVYRERDVYVCVCVYIYIYRDR